MLQERKLRTVNMADEYLINYCAPTLAGIKTGSLFTIFPEPEEDIYEEIRRLNRIFRKKGLRALLCKNCGRYALLYIYRPEMLKKDLRDPGAVSILSNKGYNCSNPDICIVQLIKHLANDKTFPHEIGLFLGYPAADVSGFIKDPNAGVKYCGCWKVYSDEKSARQTFKKYRRCTEILRKLHQKGKTLEQLAVNIEGVKEKRPH